MSWGALAPIRRTPFGIWNCSGLGSGEVGPRGRAGWKYRATDRSPLCTAGSGPPKESLGRSVAARAAALDDLADTASAPRRQKRRTVDKAAADISTRSAIADSPCTTRPPISQRTDR